MGHLPILGLFGSLAIGNIGEGNGCGCRVIGRDLQGRMQFGSLAIGNREEEVGSGPPDTGIIVSKKKFGVGSSEFGDKYSELRSPN
jgi:hypothetical protein